jgi:hypothetical protein
MRGVCFAHRRAPVGGPNGVVAMNVAKWMVGCARVGLGA